MRAEEHRSLREEHRSPGAALVAQPAGRELPTRAEAPAGAARIAGERVPGRERGRRNLAVAARIAAGARPTERVRRAVRIEAPGRRGNRSGDIACLFVLFSFL